MTPFPWYGVARRSILGDRWLAARWDAATEQWDGRAGAADIRCLVQNLYPHW